LYDLLIRNGTLVDGSGGPAVQLDVAVVGDSIVRIGKLGQEQAHETIDAEHLVVAPGFVDVHSHSELRLLAPPVPEEKIRQGITTEICGQDGISVAPMTSEHETTWKAMLSGLLGEYYSDWRWGSVLEYMRFLEGRGLPLNVSYLVPHGPLRTAVMGMQNRDATVDEVSAMAELMREAMDEGSVGLSTGLVYPPCSYADEQELVLLCSIAAEKQRPLVVHMRDQGPRLIESAYECVDICRKAGCALHISHVKARGKQSWHKVSELLELLNTASDSLEITGDQYPYTAGCTTLTAALPGWVLEGGARECLRRLEDTSLRKEIHRWYTSPPQQWENRAAAVGWQNIVISSVKTQKNKFAESLSVEEYAKQVDKHPVDAVCDLLYEEQLAATMINFHGTEDTVKQIMCEPWIMIASDGVYGGRPHPRLYGTFPRVLGKYVREQECIELTEAIRKMTSAPCDTFGLKRRGLIREGYYADIVAFDPQLITDKATFSRPCAYPEGVLTVVVNGVPVIRDAEYTNTLPGRALLWNQEC